VGGESSCREACDCVGEGEAVGAVALTAQEFGQREMSHLLPTSTDMGTLWPAAFVCLCARARLSPRFAGPGRVGVLQAHVTCVAS
jgi:hypothetical protein